MFDIILFSLLGCCTGIVVGTMPGMSNSVAMVMAYPLLMLLKPTETISFYISMITCTQYFGGAAGTLLGIPTEASCLPSVKEGFGLTTRGKASEALSSAAIGSFFGSIVALALGLIIFYIGNNYSLLYNFKLQFIILIITYGIAIFSSKNHWVISTILLLFGYTIGMIGINSLSGKEFLTFGNPYLAGGVPVIAVLVFLFSLPAMLKIGKNDITLIQFSNIKYKFILPIATFIRSSIIGFICGFIPMLGIVISSNLSYSIEKLLNRKNYNTDGDIKALVSSDAAHNAGVVSSLIPLFCFAIPITASEYILYDITTYRGLYYNLQWLTQNYYWIFEIFLLANIIGVISSWPMAINLIKIIAKNINYFKIIGIVLLFFAIFEVSYMENQLGYYMILSIILFPVGYSLRKFDTMPLMLGFILAKQFDSVIQIIYNLYLKG
jgi:putative tricarboxylic transport membrane protein